MAGVPCPGNRVVHSNACSFAGDACRRASSHARRYSLDAKIQHADGFQHVRAHHAVLAVLHPDTLVCMALHVQWKSSKLRAPVPNVGGVIYCCRDHYGRGGAGRGVAGRDGGGGGVVDVGFESCSTDVMIPGSAILCHDAAHTPGTNFKSVFVLCRFWC